jgi:hypothetical protein
MTLKEAIKLRGGGTTAELNRVFGAFTYRSQRNGSVIITSSGWSKNLVALTTGKKGDLPFFPVTAGTGKVNNQIWMHPIMAVAFKAAWTEIVRLGLADNLRTYDGLWVPRHQLWNPSNPLSVHSWAAAIDLNARWNGYGAKPTINMDVVRVFEEYGFTWGGRWTVPDGMHFQFTDPLLGTFVPAWQDAKVK